MPASTSRHLEVERKFDVDESTPAPSFAGVDEIGRMEQADTEHLDAVYFDTPAQDLASHRITLRRRTGGTDAGWHLKLPAGVDARTEVRAPLDGAEGPPAALLDVVLAIVRDRRVGPVARISTTRRVLLLRGVDDSVIAEFCDDRVSAGRGPDGDDAEVHWREWELELVGDAADGALMDLICGRLTAAGAQPAAVGSKLARVLDTAPKSLPSEPLRRGLAEQVGELLVWDRAVRAEADDSVHQMRVSARKIRSLMQASPASFGVDGDAPVIAELRELGSVLGVARDAEVLAERYRAALGDVPTALIRGPIRERLVDGAEEHFRIGRRDALTFMRSPRYFRLLDAVDAVLEKAPDARAQPALRTVAVAGNKVRKAAKQARHADDGDEAMHRIRKRAKRLRYTADVTGATKVSKRAKKLQSVLGEHQDSVVSRAHLVTQAEAAHAAGEDTFTYGLLYQREADLAAERHRELEPALSRLYKAVRTLSR